MSPGRPSINSIWGGKDSPIVTQFAERWRMGRYDRWTPDKVRDTANLFGCPPHDLLAAVGMVERGRVQKAMQLERFPMEIGIMLDKMVRFKLGLRTPDAHVLAMVEFLNMEPIADDRRQSA